MSLYFRHVIIGGSVLFRINTTESCRARDKVFAPGQLGVATSRVKSDNDLQVLGEAGLRHSRRDNSRNNNRRWRHNDLLTDDMDAGELRH